MKITGTRSYIEVDLDGKTIRISGELTALPVFYADRASIRNWNPPNESIVISEDEKSVLVQLVMAESNRDGMVRVIFE